MHAESRDAARKRHEPREELVAGPVLERRIDEAEQRGFVALVGSGPGRVALRLAHGLAQRAAQPLRECRERAAVELRRIAELRRPGAEQRLIEVVLVVRVGRRLRRARRRAASAAIRARARPTRRPAPSTRRAARACPRRASCRASPSPTEHAASAARAPHSARETRRCRSRCAAARCRPRSAR